MREHARIPPAAIRRRAGRPSRKVVRTDACRRTGRVHVRCAAGEQRESVRKREEARRRRAIEVVSYVIVSLFLVLVWLISGRGYFWPVWIMGAGAIALLFQLYLRKPITKADIDQEMCYRGCLSGRPAGEPPSEERYRRMDRRE